jgi:Putative MetA-pathway of phenol degradation
MGFYSLAEIISARRTLASRGSFHENAAPMNSANDRIRGSDRALLVSALVLLLPGAAAPQELEPRAYAPNPTGANFVVVAYTRTDGAVLFDPSLPFTDVNAGLNSTLLFYGRTFGLHGRSANAGVAVPYAWGDIEGEVSEESRRIRRSGLGDARLKVSLNLVGAPALPPREFAKRRPRTSLGLSLAVVAPTGQYDPAKLINLGANRWAFKPELGLSVPAGRWVLELYGGAWLFTPNDDFFGSSRREQRPLGTGQAHLSYTFRPRLWIAGNATLYAGGRTTVDGLIRNDYQNNSRFGLTLALPVGRRHSIKLAWATGFATRVGGDFDTLTVAWQTLWFDR